MNCIGRAMMYSVRKKGKTFGMFLLILLVSTFLISCFSILNAAEGLALDIRKSIGAAFYIRANASIVANGKGEMAVEMNSVRITGDDIARIEKCGEIAYCNPINYGYAKSERITFVPGEQDNPDNNMGQVTSLSYSSLHADFADRVISLSDGRHITETSKKAIMISAEVAANNNLSVGDKVILKSAEFGMEEGTYTDVWYEDKRAVEVSIIGIYEILEEHTQITATAAKQENRIYASLDVLCELGESAPLVYTGEVDFYVVDPAALSEMIPRVRQIESIDWKTHFIRTNDFRYSKISDSMKSLSNLVKILSVCVSVVSAAILTLILTLGIRNRVQEAGIFLAVGISKGEILMQFLLETLIAAISAFVLSYVVYFITQGSVINRLIADVRPNLIEKEALESGMGNSLKGGISFSLGIWKTLAIYLCQFVVITVSVLLSSLTILRLKPKEILIKMS